MTDRKSYSNLSTTSCSLGEGLFVTSDAIYWLDIVNSLLFIKYEAGNEFSYKLPEQASDIWKVENGRYVYLATESGIATFDTKNEQWSLISKLPLLCVDMRANDGGILNHDVYCFGTMAKNAVRKKGALYIYSGGSVLPVYTGLSIPNTFIKLNSTQMLISDSLEQVIYKFTFSNDYSKVISRETWVEHSSDNITPDGGCMDCNGNIYIAIWDGFCINKYDIDGKL